MADDDNIRFALDRLASTENIDRAIRVLEIAHATEHAAVREAALRTIRDVLHPLMIVARKERETTSLPTGLAFGDDWPKTMYHGNGPSIVSKAHNADEFKQMVEMGWSSVPPGVGT